LRPARYSLARSASAEDPLVDPVTLDDSTAHRFHAAVHRGVHLQDPAHHSALLGTARGGRTPLSSFIEKSAGPDHALAAALSQPGLRGAQQCLGDLLVVLELEEAKPAPALAPVLVEGVVDLSADPPDDALATTREEVLGLAVAEVGVEAAVEDQPPLELQRRRPQGVLGVEAERQLDELLEPLLGRRLLV
jgi:hypothetical protein